MDNYRAVYLAVIYQALRDTQKQGNLKRRALVWLASEHCQNLCDMVGVEWSLIRAGGQPGSGRRVMREAGL